MMGQHKKLKPTDNDWNTIDYTVFDHKQNQ